MKVLSKQWTQREAQRAIIGAIGISLCLFLLMNCITQGAVISTVFIPNTYDNYMDYFNSLIDSACVNPYAERNVIYPPLCYMLYRVFGSMIPAADYLSGSIYIRSTVTGMFSFGCYLILLLAAFFFFSIQYARKLHVHNRLLSIALMVAYHQECDRPINSGRRENVYLYKGAMSLEMTEIMLTYIREKYMPKNVTVLEQGASELSLKAPDGGCKLLIPIFLMKTTYGELAKIAEEFSPCSVEVQAIVLQE